MNFKYFKILPINLEDTITFESETYGEYTLTKIAEYNLLDAIEQGEKGEAIYCSDIKSELVKNIGTSKFITIKEKFIFNQDIGNYFMYTALKENNKKGLPVALSIKQLNKVISKIKIPKKYDDGSIFYK